MTNGEVWREMIEELKQGMDLWDIAEKWNTYPQYVSNIKKRYKDRGESLFKSQREYESWKNTQDIDPMRAKREINRIKSRLRIGDTVVTYEEIGVGSQCKTEIKKELKVEYIGRYFLVGRTKTGYRMSALYFDMWKREIA